MRKSLVAMLTLAFTGCGGPWEDASEDDPANDAQAETQELFSSTNARVRTTSSREAPMRWKRRFTIDETHTLYLAADVAPTPGPHTLAFEVYDPSGSVYQRIEAVFDGTEQRVFAALPVAGTWVQQYAMTGRWKVKVFIDGAPSAAGLTKFFLR